MAHAITDRATKTRDRVSPVYDIKAGETAFGGVVALIDANDLYSTTGATYCAGVALSPRDEDEYDNAAGNDGDKQVRVDGSPTVHDFVPHTSNTPTDADVGLPCYAVDNQTLSLSAADGPYFGIVDKVTSGTVWARFDPNRASGGASVGGSFVADKQTLAAAGVLSISATDRVYPIEGDGGAIELTEDLPDGLYGGATIVLIGQDDAKGVTVPSGIKTKLADGQSAELKADCTLLLLWDGTTWQELARSFNL